jgi:hypothetical protein
MSDLLSAASLLLAVVGVLYALWYPEITAALAESVPDYKEDRVKPYRRVHSVLIGRALPLSFAALTLGLIFLPDAVRITWKSLLAYYAKPGAFQSTYGAVETAFCFVVVFALAIAGHAFVLAYKLNRLRMKLR